MMYQCNAIVRRRKVAVVVVVVVMLLPLPPLVAMVMQLLLLRLLLLMMLPSLRLVVVVVVVVVKMAVVAAATNNRNGYKSGYKQQKIAKDAAKSNPVLLKRVIRFLTTPIPKSMGIIGCTLRRSSSKCMHLFLQRANGEPMFLMSARKTLSGFTITSSQCHQDTSTKIASLKLLDFGTRCNLFETTGTERTQTGRIQFSKHNKGCRKTTLVIRDKKAIRGVREFENDPPRYVEGTGYCVDFSGRSAVTSVKNTVVNSGKQRIWLVGKTGPNQFNVDMAWPLSPVQAFAFGIAAVHTKC